MSRRESSSKPPVLRSFWCQALCVIAIGGCATIPNGDGTDQTTSIRGVVPASAGGKVEDAGGLSLSVPPGALSADVEIKLTTLSSRRLHTTDSSFVAGVILEPDGLKFQKPATLAVPLAEPWPAGDPPMVLVFRGTDPAAGIASDEPVELSADRRTAFITITHFSGRVCARQCHAGVREYLEARYAERGCARDGWVRRVEAKYPGIVVEQDCASIKPGEILAIVDTFFDDYGGWDAGQPVPADKLSELETIAGSGRQVVLFFTKGAFAPRQGGHNFYGGLAHSVIVENRGGKWQMRNSFVPGKVPLGALGGVPLFWWPLADLANFRAARQGVGVETAICGAPGCLGSSDPYDVTKPYVPLAERLVPWDVVHIFVERPENNPCNRLTGSWTFDVQNGEDSGSLLFKFDEQGQIDSLWVSKAGLEENGKDVFIEYVRFLRPNTPELQDSIEKLEQAVFPAADQTQFTATVEVQFVTRDDKGAVSSRSNLFIALNGAVFSQNTPEEYFDAAYQQVVRTTEYDQKGQAVTDEATFNATIRARRVASPRVADGTGVPQEDFIAGIAASLGGAVCGAGAGAAAPLTLAGLLSARWSRRRRRATRSAA